MEILYKKPEIMSYSAVDVIEELGPCQNQYTTTLYTATGNVSNGDGIVANTAVGGGGTGDFSDGSDGSSIVVGFVDAEDLYCRGFVGFNISGIQSTVVSATLKLYQYEVSGTPYSPGINYIFVDHVDFGSGLDTSDFTIMGTLVGTISTDATTGWKQLDVTESVQEDVDAGKTASQFRLQFNAEILLDSVDNYAAFDDAENNGATGNKPELVITYTH